MGQGNHPPDHQGNPVRFRVFAQPRAFAAATMIVGIAAVMAPVLQRLPHANLSLLFLTGVLIVAIRYGLWPSIYASVLSFLLYNFFFTPPHLTLKVSEEGDVATLVFFLLMASLTGNLAARMHDAIAKREKAIRRSTELQDLTRKVAGAATREEIVSLLVNQLSAHFARATIAFVPARDGKVTTIASPLTAARPPEPAYSDVSGEHTAIRGWTTLPVDTVRDRDAIIAVEQAGLTAEEREFAKTLIDQAAVALERTRLVADLEDAKLVSQREQMRAALLSSVSHDLRTPLSSIIGSASSLATYDASLSDVDKSTLLKSVVEEAERLDRHIQNLLDMTRLGQGELRLHRDWQDLRDLLAAAARRLRLAEHDVRLHTDVDPEAELLYVHGDLMEQVFVNLLDNAARHSPTPATIRVVARKTGDAVIIDIEDNGPGIPDQERERIFEPFYRTDEGDRRSGAGLGLSICRGIMRTHGGDITAHPAPGDHGALLRIRLPHTPRRPPEIENEPA